MALACVLPVLGASPNIVLINADDLGYGDLGCYGATKVSTPDIDRLAKEGRRFTDAHTASAVCTASRYGLLTGRYPLRKNFWGPISAREPLTIDVSRPTLASVLKEAGYATACIGKWHLGFGEKTPDWNGDLKPGPLELGFDHFFGIPTVNSGPPFVYVEDHRVVGADPADPFVYGKEPTTRKYPLKNVSKLIGGAEKAHELYVDELIGTTLKDKSIGWIRKREPGKPFFLYLATTNIHHPYTPAKRFVGTSGCGLYGDFIHELDWIVGEVLAALDDMGMTDNTIVIFTSDNGGMLNTTAQEAWRAGHRINGGLLGFKFGAWEGGHRVPLIVKWPGRIPANTTSDALICQTDFLATFAAITKTPVKRGEAGDSINQLESLVGEPQEPLRETMVISPNSPKHLTVRHGKWVFIPAQGEGGFASNGHVLGGARALEFCEMPNSDVIAGKIRPDAPSAQLYDLENDPGQARNVILEHPEKRRELEAILQRYQAEIPSTRRIGWISVKQ